MTDLSRDSWTADLLKEYVDQRFLDNDARVAAALDANEKRLDGMNEFRQTIADQARDLMPRAEYEISQRNLIEKIEAKSQRAWAQVLPSLIGLAGVGAALILAFKKG